VKIGILDRKGYSEHTLKLFEGFDSSLRQDLLLDK
jgi:hypothetical protein